jgi:hypothetical protein
MIGFDSSAKRTIAKMSSPDGATQRGPEDTPGPLRERNSPLDRCLLRQLTDIRHTVVNCFPMLTTC